MRRYEPRANPLVIGLAGFSCGVALIVGCPEPGDGGGREAESAVAEASTSGGTLGPATAMAATGTSSSGGGSGGGDSGGCCNTVPASENPDQWETNSISVAQDSRTTVLSGPFALTSMHAVSGQAYFSLVPEAAACPNLNAFHMWFVSTTDGNASFEELHDIRIPDGLKLCVDAATATFRATWSGYRPY